MISSTVQSQPRVANAMVSLLEQAGVDRVFLVPGESYLGLLDALYDAPSIDVVTCRHEGGAGYMAVADARLTGRLALCAVSRGPGISNASIALHAAYQDAAPVLFLLGQVPRVLRRRGAFQEIEPASLTGGWAKQVFEINHACQASQVLLQAVRVATTGVRGPVVLSVAEDVFDEPVQGSRAFAGTIAPAAVAPNVVATIGELLRPTMRPIIVAGGSLQCQGGREALFEFATKWRVPIATSFRHQDLCAGDDSFYAGDLGLPDGSDRRALLSEADLVLALGTRLGDVTTAGYTWPSPRHRLIHVHDDPYALCTGFQAELAVTAAPRELLVALNCLPNTAGPAERETWLARVRDMHQRAISLSSVDLDGGGVTNEALARGLQEHLPERAVLTVDAGSFAAPIYRGLRLRPLQRLLAPISGAMGFGVPAGIAAALREPDRCVVALVGDGGLMMTGNELAVANSRKINLTVVVANNNSYGSIRLHQERAYVGRPIGTTLENPSLQSYAASFGASYCRVSRVHELALLQDVFAGTGLRIVEVESSLDALLHTARLPAARRWTLDH